MPSSECVFVWLEIEKRVPVNTIAQKASQKSLSLGNTAHHNFQYLFKGLSESDISGTERRILKKNVCGQMNLGAQNDSSAACLF
ncbi:hypothetical protein D3OALGA1CA_2884 [Olavius algarvensis associated proteobacterium Delta 3]|nr:hypothetical protein D3OALGA1CA_2884 [Olavius algarvensis associated proteobacterium Delta 3]CAB5162863.1 hypothetical protein D3OALGB2SA_5539 [Olavius algarvensis associated proteobacterium Delta 3]